VDKLAPKIRTNDDVKPEAVYEDLNLFGNRSHVRLRSQLRDAKLISVKDGVSLPAITAFRLLAAKLKTPRPEQSDPPQRLPEFRVGAAEPKFALLRAAVVIGSLLADGIGDAILIRGEPGAGQSLRLAYKHPPSRRLPLVQDRLRGLPFVRPHVVRPAIRHRRAFKARTSI